MVIKLNELRKTDIIIRKYTDSDRKIIAELFDNFEDFLASVDNLKRLARKDSLVKLKYGTVYLQKVLKLISKYNGIFYIAESNNQIVGFVIGIINKPSKIQKIETRLPVLYGNIQELYIEPQYRKMGIGRILIEKVEKYFIENKCTCITLSVFAPNKKARRFYEKNGYLERNLDLIKELK